jgi:hypothetical protein
LNIVDIEVREPEDRVDDAGLVVARVDDEVIELVEVVIFVAC